MKRAIVFQGGVPAGQLEEVEQSRWRFTYLKGYQVAPISLTMPAEQAVYNFPRFPPVFEGLLPEGQQLEAMLRRHKLDRNDYFGQLMVVGEDLVGALTVREAP